MHFLAFSITLYQSKLTIIEFPATTLIISGLRKQATAEAAVSITEPPKYMYVDRILSLTYSGHILERIK
jgi:hypothetical protein